MSTPTPAEILALPMQENDAGAATIRDYLVELLKTLWREGENFSGKRPFGSSGWEYELHLELGRAGFVTMTFDEDGCVDQYDRAEERRGNRLILEAINALGEVSG